jgi:hypothetical protein
MSYNFLVISNNSFSNTSNNGKTLESIFSSFDKENIFQLYFRNIENPDYNFCKNYLLISASKLYFNPEFSNHNATQKYKFTSFLNKFENLKFILVDLFWTIRFRRKKEILSYCIKNDFKFIFFLGGPYSFTHEVAAYISSSLKIPIFFYLTDDYLFSSKIKTNLWEKFITYRIKNIYQNTIAQSIQCFVIGDKMAKAYSQKFNVDFKVLINSINISNHLSDNEFKEVTIYSYFGSLHSNRNLMLKRFSILISEFHKLRNSKFEIRVFTSSFIKNYDLSLLSQNNVYIYPILSGNLYMNKIFESNYLLHFESDDPNSIEKTMFSISTKLPEYFASKRLVIGFGPKQVASMELIIDNEIGIYLDSSLSNKELINKMKLLYENPPTLYVLLVERALKFAKANFDINTNSTQFKKYIYNILYNYDYNKR